MKKLIVIAILGAVVLGYTLYSCGSRSSAPAREKEIAELLLKQVDSFSAVCGKLEVVVAGDSGTTGKEGDGKEGDGKEGRGKEGAGKEGDGKGGAGKEGDGKGGAGKEGDGEERPGEEGEGKEGEGKGGSGKKGDGKVRSGMVASDEKVVQELFLRARLSYKRMEWATEYFDPATSRVVNGAPVAEVEAEMAGLAVFEPEGLQVLEGYLFPHYDSSRRKEVLRQLKLLQKACGKYKSHFANIDLFDWQVFDAAKLEVFRIETLGITGFDNPLTLQSMKESAAGLSGLRQVLSYYGDVLGRRFDSSVSYLAGHLDFNSFDRGEFVLSYCDPLTRGISDLEAGLKIPVIRYNRLLNQDAQTLSDTDAFNVNAYSPDRASWVSPEKTALGKVLFADQGLSGDGSRSCSTCHAVEKAWADGLVKNTVFGNKRELRRNTPTLLNAALQASLFYDLRVNTLEDQSLAVVQNAEEMHGSMKLSVERLWQDTMYRRLFSAAFPKKARSGIDTLEVMNAIGSYVRSLVRLNSRFDDYMRGDRGALSGSEVAGFNLFMGKARCATCHYMPLFNGTFPPRWVRAESEVIGVPGAGGGHTIDGDMGRYGVQAVDAYKHAFKTPTVRNVGRTAPYMHNGVFTTLEQVVDFYDKGGGVGMGIKVENQTLPFDRLGLTKEEKQDLVAFMKSLDSR